MKNQPSKEFLQNCIQKLEEKYLYAAILIKGETGERIQVQRREEAVTPADETRGAVISLWNGENFIESAFNDLSEAVFTAKVNELLAESNKKPTLEERNAFYERLFPGETETVDETFHVQENVPWDSVSLEDKVNYAREMNGKTLELDERIIESSVYLMHVKTFSTFVNSRRYLKQSLPRSEKIIVVIMQEGQKNVQLHAGRSRQGGYENCTITAEDRETIVGDCRKLLNAERLEPGCYDVIFDPDFAGIFAHEAFGHGTETDQFLKHRSKGEEYINKQVASPLVNMFDSPTVEEASASYFFDDEGYLAKETQIIKDGILERGITDMNSAFRLELERTANGRRQCFANKAYSRMSNTYFGTGNDTFEEMVASMDSGYLLRYPTNGMEDPKGWGIQLEGVYVEEIKDGKLTGKIFSPVIVTGYVPELLESISMVGKDYHSAGLGFCGKGHKEWVKVTDGGPYLKLKARLG